MRRWKIVRRLAACLAVLALLVFVVPATATTSSDSAEHRILDQINAERSARGLRPLRTHTGLWDLAGDRAARMASTGIKSHAVAGSLSASLTARGIQRYAYGEDIGYSTAARWTTSSDELFTLWRNSPDHWALMMSSRYNYVGVGLAFRPNTGQTFGSIVFTESRDISRPKAAPTGVSRSGRDVTWTWSGADLLLQTHTAGLATYRVEARVDGGRWASVRPRTTTTSRTVRGLAPGHWYGIRVRATDRAGNVGSWSAEMRVYVP
jgi:hypothetical protein